MSRILVFGGNGWIGRQVCEILKGKDLDFAIARSRGDDLHGISQELEQVKPTHVMSLIGRTHGEGINTIDYLEQPGKLVENVRDNLMAPVQLAMMCAKKNIHFTYLGTGCIFSRPENPDEHAYTEESCPDFFGSSYSIVKGFTDRLMHVLEDSALNVRIRMPITGDDHPRNFITKITSYDRVCSIPNSMTVLPELLPIMVDMMLNKRTGTINLTNPGTISHNEILEMYRDIVDPLFSWTNFSMEEQDGILKSKRSNNSLDTSKLSALYPGVRPIREAVKECLVKIAHMRS